MVWQIHTPGKDPALDEIFYRRFGRDHDKPCARPEVLTCAMWECQSIDRCIHRKERE